MAKKTDAPMDLAKTAAKSRAPKVGTTQKTAASAPSTPARQSPIGNLGDYAHPQKKKPRK